MILITGASGNVGRAVLTEVAKTGKPFKAMYRSEADASKAPQGTSTVLADFSSQQDLLRACKDIETVYLVCSPIPDLVELETNVIRACQASKVKHVILNSALGAGDYQKSFPAWHRTVEDRLRASNLGYTIIRPNSFMQNILAYYAPSIRSSGVFYGGYGNARISYLDVRDIACVVAKALTWPAEHAGKIYELNGPEALTCAELAARISRVTERRAEYVDLPEAVQRKSMLDLGMPEWQVDALLQLQQYYTNGQGGDVTDVLSRLLQKPPLMLDDFLTEFKDQFFDQAASA